jgi:D-glycero-alpha-D-manno-heptose-7-phosphate kinase
LDEGWQLKREVHPNVSSTQIDDWYEAAKRAGARGGKLLGAGGGGFLMFFAPPERHAEIENVLGLRRVDLSLERSGSRVLLYHDPAPRSLR